MMTCICGSGLLQSCRCQRRLLLLRVPEPLRVHTPRLPYTAWSIKSSKRWRLLQMLRKRRLSVNRKPDGRRRDPAHLRLGLLWLLWRPGWNKLPMYELALQRLLLLGAKDTTEPPTGATPPCTLR